MGLAERFGQPPHDVMEWDASVLRLLKIEELGKEEQAGGQ